MLGRDTEDAYFDDEEHQTLVIMNLFVSMMTFMFVDDSLSFVCVYLIMVSCIVPSKTILPYLFYLRRHQAEVATFGGLHVRIN